MEGTETCTLVAGDFAIAVQVFLFVSAIGTLFYKRHRERPQRPLVVWLFDVSKQGFAGMLQHGVNMILGLMFGNRGGQAGECIWYIVNFVITTFCGLFILTIFMRTYNWTVQRYNLVLLRTGEYGNPAQCCPIAAIQTPWMDKEMQCPNRAWMAQLFIWCAISCAEKLLTASVVILPLYSYLDVFGHWLETPFLVHNMPHTELVLVMVVGPAVLNSLFMWVCDNLIKDEKPAALEVHGMPPSSVAYVAVDGNALSVNSPHPNFDTFQ